MQPHEQPEAATAVLDAPAAVRVEHLSKTFPGQRALDDVSLEIRRGEVHALVGQNGSGKSTLIKALSGFHAPDPGARAWIEGQEVELGGLSEAEQAKMRFIHQDLALVPSLTIRENLGLGPARRGPLLPVERRRERRDVRELLATFELSIDPDTVVSKLTPFEKSAVAIARALDGVDGACLLVLDEPTASMGAAEVEQLFAVLRRLGEQGVAVLYVSHFLPEVLRIADRITVLRDGRRIAQVEARDTTEEGLVELIVGARVQHAAPPPPGLDHQDPFLEVEGLTLDGLRDASFTIRPGEVVGFTGLIGSGYELIPECLAGSRPWDHGTITVRGTSFTRLTPARAVEAEMTTMPADRRGLGLIPHFTLAENVTLPRIGESWHGGRVDRRRERADVQAWLDKTGVVPPDPSRLVQELSGGNQQKVMLAKALRLEPKVLVLAEPTQAVDIGASASIRRLITQLATDDRAIVVTSSDAEELEQICHRVLVTRNGRIACELVGDDITEDRILFESQFEGGTA